MSNDDLNERILKAMQEDPKGYLGPEERATVLGLIAQSFKGTFRYTLVFVVVFQLLMAGLLAYCAYAMLNAEDIENKIHWLAGLVISSLTFGILRLWFFMELNRLSVLRDLKRLEMQVALLAAKL